MKRYSENSPEPLRNSPFGKEKELLSQINSSLLYDAGRMQKPSLGGRTTLVFNESKQEIESQHLSLAGTNRNCAGGVTPWCSWFSYEEDVTTRKGSIENDHGFVFEMLAFSQGIVDSIPIKEMGCFNHEAVAIDPNTSVVYQTEDRPNGTMYTLHY